MQIPGSTPTQTTGVTAVKHESPPLISQLPMDIDLQQSIDLRYEIKQTNDIAQITRVAGDHIEIQYPVSNTAILDDLTLIESQFAAANAISDVDPGRVDTAIINAVQFYLDQEEVELPDDPVQAARVRALIFNRARGINSRPELMDYLETHPEVAQSLGIERTDWLGSESTLSRTASGWGIDRQPVQNAICRAQHLLYRNGIMLDRFAGLGYQANQPIPHDAQLPGRLRCQGLVNYTDLLLNQLPDISLGRDGATQYSPRDIIAAMAQMALYNNPTKGRQLAQWQYERDIITPQRIQQIVSEHLYQGNILLGKSRIERLDEQLHQALFEFADNIGLFRKPIDIALDPTWVPVTGDMDDVEDTPGAIGNPALPGEAKGGFTYPLAVSFTPMASLSLGVKYVTEKSKYANEFRKLLSRINNFCNIGLVLADREFDSADMIELLRSAAGNEWIIRVRENDKMITSSISQSLAEVGTAQLTIGDQSVHVFAKDYTPTLSSMNEDGNIILLSDMSPEETDPSTLVDKYLQRWSVETYIRQIKHDFSPMIQQESAPINHFMFTIASVFYNIWAIINQSVSPIYGLPLQPEYYDILNAIVQSTFTARRQITPYTTDI
jgi:hypothetical protein